MNLNPIRANMTEVDTGRYRVLFSYKTPVAVFDREHNVYLRTSKKWSNTTTKHIGQWVSHLSEGVLWSIQPQEYFDSLLSEVK